MWRPATTALLTTNLLEDIMPQGKVVFAGLNQTGILVFIVLLLFTGPCLCWLPWLIDSMKGDPNATE